MWQQLLRNKYDGSKPLAHVQWKLGDSHFWSGLMKVKPAFLRFGSFLIKDGSQVRFWEDAWLDGSSLKDQYLALYNIARKKFISISEALSVSPPNFSWRRQLFGANLIDWLSLLSRIQGVELSHEQDTFRWTLSTNGRFSVKSHDAALMLRNIPNVNKELWKLKAPLKFKIFLWYLRKGVILTKDNLAKRNWQGSLSCASCHKEETIQHLFFDCRLARSVWSVFLMATGINQPQNVDHMFGDWLQGFNSMLKPLLLLGAAVLCWALWICRNDLVFEKKKSCVLLCRLSIWRHRSYQVGPSFSERSCDRWLWRVRDSWCERPRSFFPGCMGGDLVFGLTVARLGKLLRLCLFVFFSLAMCIRQRPEVCVPRLFFAKRQEVCQDILIRRITRGLSQYSDRSTRQRSNLKRSKQK